MQGKTHEIIGIAAASSFIYSTNLINNKPYCIALVAGSVIGSFFPDIDLQTSTAGRKMKLLSWPIQLLKFFFKLISYIFKPFKKASKLFSHRGIFHAPLIYIVIYILVYINKAVISDLLFVFITGIFIGIIFHLIADFFSGGIPVFCPLYNKKIIPFIRFSANGGINIVMITLSSIIIIYNIYKVLLL